MNYFNPWHGIIPPAQPCHTCGHCPTCGRGGYGVNPFNPTYPSIYPSVWSTATGAPTNIQTPPKPFN